MNFAEHFFMVDDVRLLLRCRCKGIVQQFLFTTRYEGQYNTQVCTLHSKLQPDDDKFCIETGERETP